MTVANVADPRPLRRRLPGARVRRDGTVLYWWGEIIFVLTYYFAYSAVRNANQGSPAEAKANALQLIGWQQTLGLNHERMLHEWALNIRPLIIACNYFYGSMHFVVTTSVLVFLYRKFPDDYALWRNAIAISTAIALIGFAFWPLMPPRLLPPSFGFVDTLDKYPTFWSFKRGAINKISNQYAAMPSVHCAWALWCALALVPRLKHTWAKVLAALYPVGTIISIVLTANHYFLDVVGGFLVLGLGFAIARVVTRAGRSGPGESEPDPGSGSGDPTSLVPARG